mgnify:CR=1 FL=1
MQGELHRGEVYYIKNRLEALAATDKRLKAHWTSITDDKAGCSGFLSDVGSWQEDRYHHRHYPEDDIGRAFRVAAARTLCLPLVPEGTMC